MSVSNLEKSKIQAQVLAPLLKAFQAEFGTERANDIARKALGSWVYKVGQQIREQGTGPGAEKIAAGLPVFSAADAQFYKELDEPELGFLFLCSQDFPLTEGLSPDLELVRTQTIMQGANHCDFRFRLKQEKQEKENRSV